MSSDFIRRAFDFRATFPWSSESLHRVIWQRKCFSAILFKGCLKELIKGSIICLRLLAGSGSVGEGLALIDPLTRGLSTSTSLTCTPGILPLAISVVAQKGGKGGGISTSDQAVDPEQLWREEPSRSALLLCCGSVILCTRVWESWSFWWALREKAMSYTDVRQCG